MLATATEPSGTTGGLRGEDYTRGEYELPSRWVSDLMAAGRTRMDIGDGERRSLTDQRWNPDADRAAKYGAECTEWAQHRP
ncbi:hypothetical protein [Actinoplanes subglobosus]|uniref:Uncharacterized protein n=1 Tax=Actinoplanes subglobosus TaxID=1547892 RepID=A0ABV8IPC0_9ACTN